MSFRFQKRVRVAPGLRLNISKRGVSTSVGRRGASVTLGRRGLYGNVGIPGSGLSYRTKLDKSTGRPSKNTWQQNDNKNNPTSVSLKFDKHSNSLVFVDEDNQKVPAEVEREIRREYKDDIQKLYEQKEKEINEQTTRLLKLHKQTFFSQTPQQLTQFATDSISFTNIQPNEKKIFDELKAEYEDDLSFLQKLKLFFPAERKRFLENVKTEAEVEF